MVVHQKILHLLLYEKSYGNRNNLQAENTQDRNLGEGGGRTQLQLKYLYIQKLYKISIEKYDWSDVIWKQAI